MSNQYFNEPATFGKVCLHTTLGDIDIELWSKECPLACRNFVQLCMEGYYNGCVFHRLVKDFIVQTGDPTGTGHGGESIYGDVFKSEFHQRLKFNRRGLVGMAGEKKDQNGSQFFFTLGPAMELTNKHTLFGKVTGSTVFNMLKMNEYDVDVNERPSYLHKITDVKIWNNPFNDIIPRLLSKEEKRRERKRDRDHREKDKELDKNNREKDKKQMVPAKKKNTSLLSFGDEMEEDEEQTVQLNQMLKGKGKSAHDLLEDELLSKERAVKPEELSAGNRREEEQMDREQLDRIKARFKPKKMVKFTEDAEDEDFDKMVDEEKEREKREKMEQITSELKQLQKEYKKATRGPRAAEEDAGEESTSEGMKMYNKLKLKFKTETKGIVKTVDPKREEQTIALLGRFQTKLTRSSVQGILMDKKVDMSDQKTQEEVILASSEEQGKMDFDAPDIEGDEWMNHVLVAPEDTSGVTKAKDASMKEYSDEWEYSIDDPRNKLNVRRRTQGGKVPDIFANAEPTALP